VIFRRSIDQNGLIYNEYFGDGDASSFNDVVSSDPYSQHGIQPFKLECVGHVQKRYLVKSHKGTKQRLSGKGNLLKKTNLSVLILAGTNFGVFHQNPSK